MNPIPVFTAAAWHQPAPGRWEAQATSPTFDGHPPFEAVCWQLVEPTFWDYAVYRQFSDTGDLLIEIDTGTARTLHGAQRGADRMARHWRDQTPTPAVPVSHYSAYSVVVCDSCGTHQQLEHVLMTGRCLGDREHCTSDTFDGHTLDALADAVTQ